MHTYIYIYYILDGDTVHVCCAVLLGIPGVLASCCVWVMYVLWQLTHVEHIQGKHRAQIGWKKNIILPAGVIDVVSKQ